MSNSRKMFFSGRTISRPKAPFVPRTRAMWIWVGDGGPGDFNPLYTPEQRQGILDFSSAHNVDILYLDMTYYLFGGNGSPEKTLVVQNFIASAHAVGL